MRTVTVRRTSLSELIIQAANSSKSTCACREVQSSRRSWVRATCITAAPRTPCHGRGHAGIAAHPAALVVVYLRPTFVHLFVRHLDLVPLKEGSDLLLGEVVVVTARACTTKDSVPLRADACRTRTEIGGAGLEWGAARAGVAGPPRGAAMADNECPERGRPRGILGTGAGGMPGGAARQLQGSG